ncbi:MAG: serine hydrolase domain-containing protein [Bacteroidota bacterium]
MKKSLLALFILITGLSSFAQLNSKKLDSLFESLDENKKWMGSIAISLNGLPIYAKAIGFADLETKKRSTTLSKYRVGSISKTFTATLIFKAIEEKKLSLTDKLSKYFPTVKNADKITINNLLNHRSGIYNFINSPEYRNYYTTKKSTSELVELISSYPPDFEPNTKFSYSNSNYVLLGYILEKVYQLPLKEILSNKIIQPLLLKNTYLGDKIDLTNNEVFSYTFMGNWNKLPSTDMSIPAGAGAVVATPSDLTIFITALLNGKIVSKQSVEQMITLTDGYGFGLFPYQFKDKKGIGHNGGIDGFSSMLFYFIEDRLSIALISNGNTYENNKIVNSVLADYYKIPYNIPTFKSINLKSEDLDPYLGEYSAPNFPLKITITKKDTVLFTQATGQAAFAVEAIEKDVFEFKAAGIVLEFNPSKKQMTVKQGGGKYILTKP